MAVNEPQTSGTGDTKFGGTGDSVKQDAEVKVNPSAVVETTTTTTKTMDVNGTPTQVQETVKTKPPEKEKDDKKAEAKTNEDTAPKKTKDTKEKSKEDLGDKSDDGAKKKKRHWLLEHLDETMARFKEANKPENFMVGFKFGYETVAGMFILADKLARFFGPKPAEAGITAKQGTVAGLHGKEGGTLKMLENAGISGNKPTPGQKPVAQQTLGTQIKQRVEGMKQGAQMAHRNAAPSRKR